MSKRRIIVIVVILAIVGLLAGGMWWWWYRNTGERLFGRAGYALQHGNYPKALRLAEKCIMEGPNEWEGYWIKGAAQSRLKRYAEARETLVKAVKVDPRQMTPVLELARTYTEPAMAKLQAQLQKVRATERGTRIELKKDVGTLQEIINDLGKANEALAMGKPNDPARQLDLIEGKGRNLARIADTYRVLAREHDRAAASESVNLTAEGRAQQRELSTTAEKLADRAVADAKAVLLDVLHQDPARGEAAEIVYRLAKQSNDREVLAEVRKLIVAMPNPPATARIQMLVDDIVAARQTGGSFRAKLNESAQVLDDLMKKNPKNLFAKRLRATIALALGQDGTAEKLCNEILQIDRGHAYARLIRARVMMNRGNVTDAERELFKLKTKYNLWVDVFLAYAEAAKAIGKKQLAIQAAQRAAKLAPDNPQAHQLLSELLKESGFGGEALKQARKALEAAPDNGAALVRFVQLAKDGDDPQEAPKKLQEMRRKYATRPEVLRAVAEGYRVLGQHDEAKKITRSVADFKPTNSKARMAVANALASLGRTPEAEVILNSELEKNPDNAQAYYAMGRLYFRSRRLSQALEMFRRAVELDSGNAAYNVELARALIESGDLVEAESALQGVDASHEGATALRVWIAIAQGRPVASEQVQAHLTGTRRSELIRALLSLKARNLDECIAICQAELKKEEPADPLSFRAILAQAHLIRGQRSQAVDQLKQVLKTDPSKAPAYWMLAKVLSRDHPLDKLQEAMRQVPGADENLVDLAVGALLAAQNKHSLARVVYERLAERMGAPEDLRHRARLRLAASLAQEKRLDDALKQLELLRGKKLWHRRAVEAAAGLLIRGRRFEEAAKALEELRKLAVGERDGSLLRRVVDLYLAMKAPDRAIGAAQQLLGMLPDDARTYLAQAKVHMAQASLYNEQAKAHLAKNRKDLWQQATEQARRRKAQAVSAIETAIEKQPGNFQVHLVLAKLLDQDEKRVQALKVLDQLASRGKAGQSTALLARGEMLASWGLHAQAAEAFRQAVKLGYIKNPALRLQLGRALAAMGQKDEARQELRAIPPYTKAYLTAQLLLANLAASPDACLTVLDRMDKARPGLREVLAKRLSVLIDATRMPDATKVAKGLIDAKKPVAAEVALLGARAMVATGDRAGAAQLCLLAASDSPRWRQLAALLLLDDKPAESAKLVRAVDQAAAYDAVIGLCLAASQGEAQSAKTWHGRLNRIEQELAKATPPRALPARLKLLAAVAAGVTGQAEQDAGKISSRGAADKVVALEFAANAAKDPKAPAEAVTLLKADAALALGVPKLAKTWAMKAFSARPTCLLAAVLVLQADRDKETQAYVLKALKPADSPLAKIIQAGLAAVNSEFGKAADLYGDLAKAFPGDPVIEMRRATMNERAGRADQALVLYTQILEKTGNPAAANNAAYLVALRYPKDAAKLQKASEWTQKAIELAPRMSALRDTMGWIAHLQGRDLYARLELRMAVRADPNSIENHYHLGVVERLTGSEELARWHLEAAVALGRKAESEKKPLPASAQQAAQKAVAALAALGPPKKKKPEKKPEETTVRVGS